jgi:probable HAF family extracellular repeat protein
MTFPFGAGVDTIAYDINDAGQVAGRFIDANGDRHPFVWTKAGGLVDLGTLGGDVGFGYGINQVGQIVGRSAASGENPLIATLWNGGGDRPPDCSVVSATPNQLWPPNHQLIEVALSGATDADGNTLAVTITGVTQDEPVNGAGDGSTAPDAGFSFASSADRVQLRKERAGGGDGRVYRIAFTADDGAGGVCSGVAVVGVPHSKGGTAVDSGGAFNSFDPFPQP